MCLKFTGSNSDGGLFTIQGLSFAVSIYFGTFLSSETFFPGFCGFLHFAVCYWWFWF